MATFSLLLLHMHTPTESVSFISMHMISGLTTLIEQLTGVHPWERPVVLSKGLGPHKIVPY